MPKGKTIIHATLDSLDLNKDVEATHAIIGDAALILDALLLEVKDRLKGKPRGRADGIAAKIAELNTQWIEDWTPKLTDTSTPINPYRVIWDLLHTVDVPNTIMTHDAGSPRDQIVPFWKPTDAALVHRLGQDDPARVRPRPGDGRQAGPPGQAVRQLLGRRRHRLHRAWTSRRPRASGSRSCPA